MCFCYFTFYIFFVSSNHSNLLPRYTLSRIHIHNTHRDESKNTHEPKSTHRKGDTHTLTFTHKHIKRQRETLGAANMRKREFLFATAAAADIQIQMHTNIHTNIPSNTDMDTSEFAESNAQPYINTKQTPKHLHARTHIHTCMGSKTALASDSGGQARWKNVVMLLFTHSALSPPTNQPYSLMIGASTISYVYQNRLSFYSKHKWRFSMLHDKMNSSTLFFFLPSSCWCQCNFQ